MLILLTLVACAGESPGCPAPQKVVAAGATVWAESCPAEVTLRGRVYSVAGGRFHHSWIGERFSLDAGEYEAAYRLRDYPLEEAFVLGPPTNAPKAGYSVAVTDEFTESKWRRIEQPYRRR